MRCSISGMYMVKVIGVDNMPRRYRNNERVFSVGKRSFIFDLQADHQKKFEADKIAQKCRNEGKWARVTLGEKNYFRFGEHGYSVWCRKKQ